MKKIAISEFKAKCLAILDEVKKTQQPVLVTRRGQLVATISPPPPNDDRSWIGSMQGKSKILGDIVSPANDESDWEALRD